MRSKRYGWLLLAGLLAGLSGAAAADSGAPTYVLRCAPSAGYQFGEWIKTRLALRGWREDTAHPAVSLCFGLQSETAWRSVPAPTVYGGYGGWRGGGGWGYGAGLGYPGDYREPVRVGVMTLRVTGGGASPMSSDDRQTLAGDGRQDMEDAATALIERLQWPSPERGAD